MKNTQRQQRFIETKGVRLSLLWLLGAHFTAEDAENAEALILKQRTTTKDFHRRERGERRGSDFKAKNNNNRLSPLRTQRTQRL